MEDLRDKRALVTGASTGIGAAVAKAHAGLSGYLDTDAKAQYMP